MLDAGLLGGDAGPRFLHGDAGIVRGLLEAARIYRALPGRIADPGAKGGVFVNNRFALSSISRPTKRRVFQRDKPVTIDVQSLADLLLNTRRSVHSSINGMQLALELLTQNIDGSPVRLDEIHCDRAEGVINLYETLRIVHERVSGDILI